MKRLGLVILLSLAGCAHHNPVKRYPAAVGDDPCKVAMTTLLARAQTEDGLRFVDEVIDANRLIDQGFLSGDDLRAIETSSEWNDFFLNSRVDASSEEQVLVAALLRKAEPTSSIESLQRKYDLLFEFCGL